MSETIFAPTMEEISGSQGGVHFTNGTMKVIARSPEMFLLWVSGTNYHSGIGAQAYASPHLMLYSRTGKRIGYDVYRSFDEVLLEGQSKVRLTADTVRHYGDKIDEAFGQPVAEAIANSLKTRRTILLNGGGDKPKIDARALRRDKAKIVKAARPDSEIELDPVTKTCRNCGEVLLRRFERHDLGFSDHENHPTSLAEAQLLTNKTVWKVEGYSTGDLEKVGLVQHIWTWDGESYYPNAFFCSHECGEQYGIRVASGESSPSADPMAKPENFQDRDRSTVSVYHSKKVISL